MVIWSDVSRNDLRSIHDFIALDSEFYAKKVINDIVVRVTKIPSFPKIGRIVP